MPEFSERVNVAGLRRHDAALGYKYVCGFYSLDGAQRHYRGDLSQLRYLRLPRDDALEEAGWDLDVGADAAMARDDARQDPRLDNLLRWIKDTATPKDLRWESEIVTNRRTLLLLMRTPFGKPTWRITATLFQGVVFLFSTCTEDSPDTDRNRRLSMWGHKFEEYVTTDKFKGDVTVAETDGVLDPKFYAVFAYETDEHRILYGAEIDCVESPRRVQDLRDLQRADTKFVEFKTNKIPKKRKEQVWMQRSKFPKWWEQCFLANIETVVCGFRTDSGIVRDVKVFTENDLLYNDNVRRTGWSPRVCLNFLDDALSFIKSVILMRDRNAPAGTEWVFEAESVDNAIQLRGWRKSDHGPEGDVLLPRWFTAT